MEKISAARAMEWSIELEKGLRSKKPGQSIEVITSIGPRLQQWSMESSITNAISDMYGLVPGEDRLFANTILLRLANAFKSGDNCTRRCILKVFLLEVRHLRQMGKRYNGILAKQRVPNYVELLKRVKTVFDTGDTESKALTLRLFGCLAGLAKDSTQVRYMILLSLQSPHVSEVKASLFAAGCFCLLSDDFACVVLEILTDIVSSLQGPPEVIFTAVRVFSKMRSSSSITTRAYKAGKKLVIGSVQEEFKAEMLSSLSILASRSIILDNEQVDLLLSCLTGENTDIVKARALKCLYFQLRRGYNFPVNSRVLNKLFHIVDDNDLPPIFHCQALRILCKVVVIYLNLYSMFVMFSVFIDLYINKQQIFCSMRADLTYVGVPDLLKFARIVEGEAQSSAEENKYLCLRLLASILCSLKTGGGGQCNRPSDKSSTTCLQSHGRSPVSLASSGEDPEPLVKNCTSYIIDHMQHLMKMKFSGCDSNMVGVQNSTINDMHSTMKKRWKHLLDLVLPLTEQYPSSGLVALDRIICLIEILASMRENFKKHTDGHSQMEMVADKPISVHPNSVEEVRREVYKKVKLLVVQIELGGYCDGYAYEIFCLCMRSANACPYSGITDNGTQDVSQLKDDVKLGLLHDVCWVCREWRTLEFTKTMLRRQNNWAAYRAGKYACGRGLWFAATFTFRKLIDMIQSDSCRHWLRSLMLLSGGESEIKLLLFPEVGKELVGGLQTESESRESFSHISGDKRHCVDIEVDLCDNEAKLARVYSRICSSEEILLAAGASDGVFFFQRWFLILRAKVLETLIDLLGLLSSHTINQKLLNGTMERSADIHSTVKAPNFGSILASFIGISLRWSRLAKEYDLLATSFPDIDCESFRSISSLSLNCSLLSFCTTFALYLPKSPTYENGMLRCFDDSTKFSPAVILRDLFERLLDVDEELTTELEQFMPAPGEVVDNYQPRTHINSAGYMEKASLLVYRFAIAGVLHSQEEAKGASDEQLYLIFMRGLQLISDVIRKWLGLPFQTPKFFFRVRPCIGAYLFIHNGDPSNKHEISCLAGSQLSLNLCLQIKNASIKVAKVYCILAARSSDHLSGGREERIQQMLPSFNARNSDEMVELSELLLMYMRTDTKGTSSCDLVTTFVCFELNQNGQGFSSCVLDVSAFPVSLYPIKWHSCCFVENGSLWSLIPLNSGCIFSIKTSED